jgi:rod shape-determining protein MreD
MKTLQIALLVIGSVLLQSLLTLLFGGAVFDLVLVAAVIVGLLYGRVAGLLAGAAGGMLQDALSGGILGLSGLGKSLVGYLAGLAGTQFIVTQAMPRGLVFLGATFLNAACFMGLSVLLGLRQYDGPFFEVAVQGFVNAGAGVLLFYALEQAPTLRARWNESLEFRRKRRR